MPLLHFEQNLLSHGKDVCKCSGATDYEASLRILVEIKTMRLGRLSAKSGCGMAQNCPSKLPQRFFFPELLAVEYQFKRVTHSRPCSVRVSRDQAHGAASSSGKCTKCTRDSPSR